MAQHMAFSPEKMAQYGGEQYMKEEGNRTGEYAHNPLHSTNATHEIGTTGTTMKTGDGHGHEEGKHAGGILHRTGSGSSSSSEDDGEGGRRKKKGAMEKIKEKLPGGDHGGVEQNTVNVGGVGDGDGVGGGGYEGAERHEKKGLMEKIKEKLPGGN